jgi:hypothetical protein
MLSLELIGILGLLFGLVVYGMVATQLEHRRIRIAEQETRRSAEPAERPVKAEQQTEHSHTESGR